MAHNPIHAPVPLEGQMLKPTPIQDVRRRWNDWIGLRLDPRSYRTSQPAKTGLILDLADVPDCDKEPYNYGKQYGMWIKRYGKGFAKGFMSHHAFHEHALYLELMLFLKAGGNITLAIPNPDLILRVQWLNYRRIVTTSSLRDKPDFAMRDRDSARRMASQQPLFTLKKPLPGPGEPLPASGEGPFVVGLDGYLVEQWYKATWAMSEDGTLWERAKRDDFWRRHVEPTLWAIEAQIENFGAERYLLQTADQLRSRLESIAQECLPLEERCLAVRRELLDKYGLVVDENGRRYIE